MDQQEDFIKEYATVAEEDGGNYRDIAEVMCDLGYEMNHSSARNYVVRVMKKFAVSFSEELLSKHFNEETLTRIAKDPLFQSGVSELLHVVELERRREDYK